MKFRLSLLAWAFILIVSLVKVATLNKWKDEHMIMWDVEEYYMYVPATYIYHDLGFSYISEIPEQDRHTYGLNRHPETGKAIGRMSFGMALAYSPFFWLAHLITPHTPYRPNGYSPLYQLAVLLTGAFYMLMGLWFMRLTLQKYFTDGVVAITLLCIGLGTNLYYYSLVEGGMTHATLFGLCGAFLYYTICWHEAPQLKHMLRLAFFLGFAALIRPTNILISLLFILYGLGSAPGFKCTLKKYLKYWKHLLIPIIFIPLILVPQFIFWKAQTGHWFYYSYGDEGFFFGQPRIWKGLFSYRKGWLVYTPMMALALLGFASLRRYAPKLFLPVLFYTVLNIYIVLSWWCWWYGGGFGMRAFIESYAFLALPMAALWQWVWNRKWLVFATGGAAFFFLFLNQFQTEQYQRTLLHWDSMSKKLYWATFLKGKPIGPRFNELADPPDYEAAKKGEPE